MQAAQACQLLSERRMIGREVKLLAALDLLWRRRRAISIELTAVEGFSRNQASRRLARIERGAGRIPIGVNDCSRHRGSYNGRAEVVGEGVELVDIPIGVTAREVRRDEAGDAIGREFKAGVWKRDDERRVVMPHGKP